jgi:hypothetical protein
MKSKLWLCASAVLLTFGLLTQQMGGAPRTTAVRTETMTAAVVAPPPTTTTVAPTTTSTTAPALNRPTPHPVSRSYVRPAPSPAPAPPATNGWPTRVLHAAGCMDNGPHSVALAHQCWDGLIAKYPWPTATMFNVMMCESAGNPWDTGIQTSYGRARGLMQDMEGPYDPEQNMAVAYSKYRSNGLGPWVSSRNCWG